MKYIIIFLLVLTLIYISGCEKRREIKDWEDLNRLLEQKIRRARAQYGANKQYLQSVATATIVSQLIFRENTIQTALYMGGR